jgi:hypothetical protein
LKNWVNLFSNHLVTLGELTVDFRVTGFNQIIGCVGELNLIKPYL